MGSNKPFLKYVVGAVALFFVSVWLAIWAIPDNNFHLVTCDVGQGDAILATAGTYQILTDGGPGKKVLDCLGRHMPFWDREIEVVVLTHPQIDHFGGMTEVFKRFKVDTFVTTTAESGTSEYQLLKNAVGSSGARVVDADVGTQVRVGKMQLDIVHPPKGLTSSDDNDLSIVSVLKYSNFEALLTGDLSPKATEIVLQKGLIGPVKYIKVPHHGSRYGLTKNLLEITRPAVAVISLKKDNIYGHPHKETLDLLDLFGVKVYRTDQLGDVEIVSDGTGFVVSSKYER